MLDIDLNKKYIDLNSIPVSSSENKGIVAEEHNDVPAVDGPVFREVSREPSTAPIPDESSSQSHKKRGRKSSIDLPAGWVVYETVRLDGKSAGKKDKHYIEPVTGKNADHSQKWAVTLVWVTQFPTVRSRERIKFAEISH